MAYINVTSRVADIYNSENIEAMLNGIIERELSKDESRVNTELINDCVDALINLEMDKNNGFNALIPLMSSSEFLNIINHKNSKARVSTWKSLSKAARVAIVAAVLAGSTLTANAAIATATDVNIIQELGVAIQNSLQSMGILKTNIEILPVEDDEGGTTKPQGIEILPVEDDDEETTTEPSTVPTTTKPHGIEILPVEEDDDETTTRRPGIEILPVEDDDDETTTRRPGIEILPVEEDDDETTTTTKPVSPTKPTKPNKPIEPTTAVVVTVPQETTTHHTDEPNPEPEPEPVYLLGVQAEFDNFKTDYVYGEELTYEGITLTAVYSDGSTMPVSLDDCSCTTSVNMNVTADYTLRIIYQTCVIEIPITVRPDEDTRGAEECSNDDFEYLLTDRGAYVTKYKGSATNINIDTIDGNDVVSIGSEVFNDSEVEYISAQNVEKIFPNAFKNCTSLVDCYTPRATDIGEGAFENCTSLREAVFSENATYIGARAYSKTAIEEFTLPEGIEAVPEGICEECKELKTVNLLSKPERIGANAFAECTALELVTGTENISTVEDYGFTNDENVIFDAVPVIEYAGNGSFSFCKNINFGEQNE